MTGARRVRLIAVVLSSVTLGAAGCGGSSGGGTVAAKNITISATLSAAGTVGSSALTVSSPLTALAGYKLYCVTFSTPPVSGTATADAAGSVTLTLAAQNVPFGCFILDAAGNSVASLMFANNTQSGQTLSLSGDADLGAITVDATSGVANAAVPAAGTLTTTTPAGVACPLGTWSFVSTKAGNTPTTGSFWIAQTGPGTYSMSVNAGGTVAYSLPNIPATYDGKTMNIGPFYTDTHSNVACEAGRISNVTVTADAGCTTLTGTLTQSNCVGGCNCGTESVTATRL